MDQWRNTSTQVSENVYICLKTPVFLNYRQSTAGLAPPRDALWEWSQGFGCQQQYPSDGLPSSLCSGTEDPAGKGAQKGRWRQREEGGKVWKWEAQTKHQVKKKKKKIEKKWLGNEEPEKSQKGEKENRRKDGAVTKPGHQKAENNGEWMIS